MKVLQEFFIDPKVRLQKKIKGKLGILPAKEPSLTNTDLWTIILFCLHPNDFFKMGRVSLWFYATTRNELLIKRINKSIWAYLFHPNELAKQIKTCDEVKDLIISGKNNVLLSFSDEMMKGSLRSSEYLTIALCYDNFVAFRFFAGIIKQLANRDLHNLVKKFDNFEAYIRPLAFFGFKCKKLSNQHSSELKKREQHKNEMWNRLVKSGTKWVMEVISIFEVYSSILENQKSLPYQDVKENLCWVDIDFLSITKNENPKIYEELMKSSLRNYILELSQRFVLAEEELHTQAIYKNALSEVPNKNQNTFFVRNREDQRTKELQARIDKLEEKLAYACNLISVLTKELDEIKQENNAANSNSPSISMKSKLDSPDTTKSSPKP